MGPVVKAIEIRDGVRLQYVEQGDPSGVPVLLLHGFTDSWRSFERVLPHLPPSIRAFALTQRGHGDSDRPDTGYRTRDFAADAAAFADAAGLGPAIIVAIRWAAPTRCAVRSTCRTARSGWCLSARARATAATPAWWSSGSRPSQD